MIKLQSINKQFKNRKRTVHALTDINLTFGETGLCFIVGESGAGKSSLLNIISLQDRATSGSLIIDNVDTLNLKRKDLATLRSKYFGIVFQDLNLINDFSVFTNISLGLELQKKKVTKDEVIDVLNKLHLPNDIIDEKVKNLSGGQKQRVAIARTLIKNPKVIICDEPTGSIDNKNGLEIMAALKEISKDKLVIIVSHDLAFASTYADRIINIEEGHIVSDNNPVEEYDVEEKLNVGKHNHLSFLSMIKLALSSMKQSVPKLIFMMIGFILSLSIFLVSMTIFSYNSSNVKEKMIASDNVTYFTLQRINENEPSYEEFANEWKNPLTKKDLDIIAENYDESSYVISHINSLIDYSTIYNFAFPSQAEDPFHYETNKIASINQEQIDDFGFDLIGRLPKENEYELMLTSYTCYKLGWISYDEMDDQNLLKEIVKSFTYFLYFSYDLDTPIELRISGVLNTHRIVKEDRTSGYVKYDNYADRYELHSTVFFAKDTLEQLIEYPNSKAYISTKNHNYTNVNNVLEQFDESTNVMKAKCRIEDTIEEYESLQSTYGIVISIIGLILLLISTFTLVGYTRISIYLFMKNITILRSMGLTGVDSSEIFILQSVFISLLCIIFTSLPYGIALHYVNEFAMFDALSSFAPLTFSIPILLLALIGMIILSSIITIISVAIVFHKKAIRVNDF